MGGSLQGFHSQLYAAAGVFGNAGGSEKGDNDPHHGGFLFPQVGNQHLPREGLGFHWGPTGNKGTDTNPQTKALQSITNNVVNNQEAFQNFYDNPDNQGMWWKPTRLMI
jgi:hypothetical protein